MAGNALYKACFALKSIEEVEEDKKAYQRYEEIVATFPTREGWTGNLIYQYQGFWYDSRGVGVGPLAFQDQFKARDSDILVATTPKCGTTWLKSLVFAIMNRNSHPPSSPKHPLHIFNSHDLMPFMELRLYNNRDNDNQFPNLDVLPSPRLFGTHMPYPSLPESIAHSNSKIVYICRNTKDTLVSWWHFFNKHRSVISLEPMKLEEAFELFCKGISPFGPFWDHMLGYWKGSLERPQNVLFLKCDDMLAEPTVHLKRMAEFLGCHFSLTEEREGVIDHIIKLCSFESLSNLAVNKIGTNIVVFHTMLYSGKVKLEIQKITSHMR